MNKASILIVDDEIPICRSIASALEKDYDVTMALSGEEALRMIGRKAPDLMIVDIMMPGMTGMDLLHEVKEKEPGVQLIMVTGYPSTKTAVQAVKMGAFDYIPKPFSPAELRSLVARALQRRRIPESRTEHSGIPPKDLYTIPEHAWARIEPDGTVRVGMHPIFLETVASWSSLELPEKNEWLGQGMACLKIHDKAGQIHRLWSPISGRVLEVNPALSQGLDAAVRDPYGEGWILVIDPAQLQEELNSLTLIP